MKKLISVLVSLLMGLMLFCACAPDAEQSSSSEESRYPTAIPSYDRYVNERELKMFAFWSPPITEQQYSWVAECGFNNIIIDAKYDALAGTDALMNALRYCEKYGIKGYPTINRGANVGAYLTKSDYSSVSSFGGFYTDEPLLKSDIDIIKENTSLLKSKYSSADYLTTLITNKPNNDEFESYEQYIDYYMETTGKNEKMFLFDIYALLGNEFNSTIRSKWLSATEVQAQASKKYNVPMVPYISSMSIRSQSVRHPNEEDIRYQSYVNLAYGAKGIAYFCYMSPGLPPYNGEFVPADYALIKGDDNNLNDYSKYERTETWYEAQRVNKELLSFDHVLLSFDWKGVLASRGTDAQTTAGDCFEEAKQMLLKHDRISSINSTEDAIIGCFSNEKGYDGFLAVNFSDPAKKRNNEMSIDFAHAKKLVVYSKNKDTGLMEKSIVKLENGNYKTTIGYGDAEFIIPIA